MTDAGTLEEHRTRQTREAQNAFNDLRGPVSAALRRRGLEPIPEDEVSFPRARAEVSLEDWEWSLRSEDAGAEELAPPRIISDARIWEAQVEAAAEIVNVLIPEFVREMGGDFRMGQVVLDDLRGQFEGQSIAEIARGNSLDVRRLRKVLARIRRIFDAANQEGKT